jgi:hypothetical protein
MIRDMRDGDISLLTFDPPSFLGRSGVLIFVFRIHAIYEYLYLISLAEYRKLALSLPDAAEVPHFENPSFRINKKIFATYWLKEHKAMLKLSAANQSSFYAHDKSVFYPVARYWGKQGATFVNLAKVRNDMFKDALQCAYAEVGKKKKKK